MLEVQGLGLLGVGPWEVTSALKFELYYNIYIYIATMVYAFMDMDSQDFLKPPGFGFLP